MNYPHLQFQNFGKASDVLQLQESKIPNLEKGQVLLEILASPINPADLNFIEGTYGVKPALPATPGIECFAEVLQSSSEKFQKGDRVIPVASIGGWAKNAIASEAEIVKVGPEIDPIQAAMLKVNPATAKVLLEEFESLSPGDTIVFNAANSGVGQCIIQLARESGIKTIGFLRNLALSEELKNLGADCILEDSKAGLEQAKDFLAGEKAGAAFNAVGGESALRLMKLLRPSANHITYGAMAKKPLTIANGSLIFSDIRVRGLWVTRWLAGKDHAALSKFYGSLSDLVVAKKLHQKVDSTFQLKDFKQALARLEKPERDGKILFSQR